MYICMYVSAAYVYYVYVAICMNIRTVYTPPIWKNGYAEYRSKFKLRSQFPFITNYIKLCHMQSGEFTG